MRDGTSTGAVATTSATASASVAAVVLSDSADDSDFEIVEHASAAARPRRRPVKRSSTSSGNVKGKGKAVARSTGAGTKKRTNTPAVKSTLAAAKTKGSPGESSKKRGTSSAPSTPAHGLKRARSASSKPSLKRSRVSDGSNSFPAVIEIDDEDEEGAQAAPASSASTPAKAHVTRASSSFAGPSHRTEAVSSAAPMSRSGSRDEREGSRRRSVSIDDWGMCEDPLEEGLEWDDNEQDDDDESMEEVDVSVVKGEGDIVQIEEEARAASPTPGGGAGGEGSPRNSMLLGDDEPVFQDEFESDDGEVLEERPGDDWQDSSEPPEVCPACGTGLAKLAAHAASSHLRECGNGDSYRVLTPATNTPAPFEDDDEATRARPAPNGGGGVKQTLSSFLPKILTGLNAGKDAAAGAVSKPNAFTALMQGHAEVKQWKAAEDSDKMRGRLPAGVKRQVPFYKWIEGMEITVDAFRYGKIPGCKGYYLSHAHSDHYQLLNKSWQHGPIYCSLTTANLIKLKLGVDEKWVKALPLDETVDIDGIKVTLIDANHCPGSVLFLFEGPQTDPKSPWCKTPSRTFRYLHCGDFRASPAQVNHPAIKGKHIDICYLDTTYLDPKYCFPAQELVIDACASLVRSCVAEGDEAALYRTGGETQVRQTALMKGWLVNSKKEEEDENGAPLAEPEKSKKRERWVILVGMYSVGKERIVKGIAQAIGTKVYASDYKMALLKAQDDPLLQSMLTSDPLEAQVHVTDLFGIKHEFLSNYLSKWRNHPNGFTRLIGLRPTGWTYKPEGVIDKNSTIAKVLEREKRRKFSPAGMYPQRDSTTQCLAFGVPYSEHSSFYELTCFALSLPYTRMIPTVNVHTATSRSKMQSWFERWQQEKKRRADNHLGAVPGRSPTYW